MFVQNLIRADKGSVVAAINSESARAVAAEEALDEKVGDITAFTGSTTGNISNGEEENATNLSDAVANIDATMGQIHGLAAKLESVGTYNGNLASGTTVEQHLTALDAAIGNRTNLSGAYVSNADVATNLQSLNDGLESEVSRATAAENALGIRIDNETNRATAAENAIRQDLQSTKVHYDTRFNQVENRINKLQNKMEKGLAAI